MSYNQERVVLVGVSVVGKDLLSILRTIHQDLVDMIINDIIIHNGGALRFCFDRGVSR